VNPELRNRSVAGIVLAILMGVGGWYGTTANAATEVELQVVLSKRSDVKVEQRKALDRGFEFEKTREAFVTALAQDVTKHALGSTSIEELEASAKFFHVVSEQKELAPGGRIDDEHVSVVASVEKVTYQKGGASIRADHSVVTVKNVSSRPIAWFGRFSSVDRGRCEARGARRHNTNALWPNEEAQVPVCAGSGGVVVEDLRVLELTNVGYVYLSQVPPQTFGYDENRSQSHTPPRGVTRCALVPATQIANRIKNGDWKWEDVADFYARHNCQRHQIPNDYVMAKDGIKLPVVNE
jgi:hypothetical protein